MLPGPLAPLDVHKTRALSTIYAPRKLKPRKHKTAKSRMLENDIPIKPGLSPFHPLPAIGKNNNTKVIVFDLKPENRSTKLHEVLKPLSPLNIHGFRKRDIGKPQQLIRENTYDLIEPIYLSASKDKIRESKPKDVAMSPKTRFKNAAMQVARLASKKETGKLLCLREKESYSLCQNQDTSFRLQRLPQSPAEKLNKLSEIFQGLDMKGRHRDTLKKENSWF